MQDKKILALLGSSSRNAAINTFFSNYVRGRNIDLTLITIQEHGEDCNQSDESDQHEELLDQLCTVCTERSIPLRITEMHSDAATAIHRRGAFVDLIIIEKDVLRKLALQDELPEECSAIIALPDQFDGIRQVLLMYDGSHRASRAVKSFYQYFTPYARKLDATLLHIDKEATTAPEDVDLLLVEYLRQFSENIGILKVEKPINEKHLRALPRAQPSLVVANLDVLMALRGPDTTFKPFYDEQSILFIPATYS